MTLLAKKINTAMVARGAMMARGVASVLLVSLLTLIFVAPISAVATTSTGAANATAVPSGPEFGAPSNNSYTLLEPLPCIPGTGNNCATGSSVPSVNIQTYIIYVFKLMVALAVLAAVVMCIIGGFQYMLSESVTKKQDAKDTIKNAVLGLVGALGSWLILYTINPNLVNISLVTVPKLNVTTTNINLSPSNVDSGTQAANQAITNAYNQNQQSQAAQSQADSLRQDLEDANCVDGNGNLEPGASASCQTLYNQYIGAQETAASSASQTTLAQANAKFSSSVATMQLYASAQSSSLGGLSTTNTNSPADIQAEFLQLSNQNITTYNTYAAQLRSTNNIAGLTSLTQAFDQAQASLRGLAPTQ